MKLVPRIIKKGGEMALALAAAGLELALDARKPQGEKKKAGVEERITIRPRNPRVWLWPS